jgi:DNA-binding NarL/FixJ family response regulator
MSPKSAPPGPAEAGRVARVLLVDDHPAVRQGVAMLLTARRHVIAGEAENRRQALARLQSSDIDLVLLDLSLDQGSGFDLLIDLEEFNIPALVYSMHEDPETIERTLQRGAMGYVTKREKPKVLLEAVAGVMAGGRFLSPRAAQSLAEGGRAFAPTDSEQGLSERESQILARLGRGETRLEIAAAMGISTRTVETYCERMIHKLKLSDMNALRKYAISHRHAL